MKSGKELRNIRQVRDIKAKYIAERLGVTGAYICNLEKGKQNIPMHIYKKWVDILSKE